MTQKTIPDDLKRTIVLIYGMLDSGAPFWVFAAVRPVHYKALLEAYKDGSFDIYQFDKFGEIIVCGEGKSPPEDITLKVAEMYQTDPAVLMAALESEP